MNDHASGSASLRNRVCQRLRLSISTKFILLLAVVLSIGLAAESMVTYQHQQTRLLEDLKEKAAIQGRFVSAISREAIIAHDYVALNRYMEEISQIDDIVYGMVVSPSGQHMTSYLNPRDPYIQRAGPDKPFAEIVTAVDFDPRVITATYAIMVEQQHIADFVIGVDKSRLQSLAREELFRQLTGRAALIALLGVAIYLAFRRSTVARIRNLMAGATRVAAGNLLQPVEITSNDEICDLTQSFNRMMVQLRESNARTNDAMGKLRDMNKGLEARVQERTARLELAQRIAQMGHWDYDTADRSFHLSGQVHALFGLDPTKPLRLTAILRAIHKDDRRMVFSAFTRALAKATPFSAEFRVWIPEQAEKIVTAMAEPTRFDDTGSVRLFGIAQDVTARALAERIAHKALIEKMDAESASEAKSAFLANMSHEIRTPLTAIIGFAETLQAPSQGALDQREAAHRIVDNGRHLLHIINEILDLSKIESHRLEVEKIPVDPVALLNDVESVAGMLARDKGLDFSVEYEYPLPRQIETDPTRLKQIILNLCGNAIKFTQAGSVRLKVSCKPELEQLQVAVADTGVGIAPEQLGHLFQPFTQADSSTTRRFGGTGLGLYISRQLALLLGGEVEIQSVLGLGTRVEATVATGPLNAESMRYEPDAEALVAHPESSASPRALRGKVLLVEDSEDNQRLISLYIRQTGAQVELAENGRVGFEKAMAGDFDLVLMDMQMPVMGGLAATDLLRRAGYGGPIVALTANAFKEDRERAAEAGCDDFLTKPIDRPAFSLVLQRYLPADGETSQSAEEPLDVNSGMGELVMRFVDSLPERIRQMQVAETTINHGSLKELVHQLKGLGGSFGYPEITSAAAVVDGMLKHDQTEHLAAALSGLYDTCHQAIDHSRQQRKSA